MFLIFRGFLIEFTCLFRSKFDPIALVLLFVTPHR